jgi:hypothetical protein
VKASDLYYMKHQDGSFFLVTKEFWKEHKHINDCHFGDEIWDVLPENLANVIDGFEQISDSCFAYYENGKKKNKKGIEILQSLGIQEVLWGQAEPLETASEIEDTAEGLLEECLEALGKKHSALIERIESYLDYESPLRG